MKNIKQYEAIGLMSGTSLDGLDIVCCRFKKVNNNWGFELKAAETIEYPYDLYELLKMGISMSAYELKILDISLGEWFGKKVNEFIEKYNLIPQIVSSHGHTIFHKPEKRLTHQIGDGHSIRAITGITTINDFRSGDVAHGGQGAPLVPIGDRHLFSEYEYCLNLGGIANISFEENGQRRAFDICECNMVLNRLASEAGLSYDVDGKLASKGELDLFLLKHLDSLSYYQTNPPKSLGYEWVNENVFVLTDDKSIRLENRLHTVCEHIGKQIASAIRSKEKSKLLITGGGASNKYLIEVIRRHLWDNIEIIIPSDEILQFKEAIIFAFIGILRLEGEINILASVTGADKDSCGGVIYD